LSQADRFTLSTALSTTWASGPGFALHDRDKCLCADFDAVLRSAGVEAVKTPCCAPNANPFIDRWGWSLREKCPNHLPPDTL